MLHFENWCGTSYAGNTLKHTHTHTQQSCVNTPKRRYAYTRKNTSSGSGIVYQPGVWHKTTRHAAFRISPARTSLPVTFVPVCVCVCVGGGRLHVQLSEL